MGANKKKKTAATVGAVALAAALVLTGTYAWNSISQKAKNENIVYANPGGRLHDDWNGSKPSEGVKRVYVENFSGDKVKTLENPDGKVAEDKDAAPIYVRVRLQTYMEFGEDAGVTQKETAVGSGTYTDMSESDLDQRNVKQLVSGTKINKPETWSVYIKGQSDAFQSYFSLETKTDTELNYMPTFNKNKESLLADINGTYEGTSSDDTLYFDDYTDWETFDGKLSDDTTVGKKGDAYYYQNGGTAAANQVAGDETVHIKNPNEEHKLSKTLTTKKIVTMDEWLDYSSGDKVGNYWVYDEDGWAYWAQPLEPGTATGPLLTDVKMKNSLGENCYYAINVTGEFASAGDWGDPNGADDEAKGFYLNKITDNALTLLETIAKTAGADWVNITATADGATVDAAKNTITVDPGKTVTFTGEVTLMGDRVGEQGITWAIDHTSRGAGATLEQSGNNATLTIPEDLPVQTIKVTATPTANPDAVVTYKVKVAGPDKVTINGDDERVAPGKTLTFTANVTKKTTGGTDEAYVGNKDVKWSIKGWIVGTTKINESTGVLSVAATEPSGTTLTVIATSVADGKVVGEKEIRVTNSELPLETLKTIDEVKVTEDGVLEGSIAGPNGSILGNRNNTKTIKIDGVSFFVIAKKDGKALLLTEKGYKETKFSDQAVDTTTEDTNRSRWKDSTIRAYLNSTESAYAPIDANGNADGNRSYTNAPAGWLNGKSKLASAALPTELKTLQEYNDDVTDTSKIDTTKDKIFFLSEADIFGSTGETEEERVPASFYTITKTVSNTTTGVKLVAPNGTWVAERALDTTLSYNWWWLRSSRDHSNWISGVNEKGKIYGGWYSDICVCVRPACWISL